MRSMNWQKFVGTSKAFQSGSAFRGLLAGAQSVCLFLALAIGVGAATTPASPSATQTNLPTSFKPDFEPNLPVLLLTARGSIDKAQRTPCTLVMVGPGAPPVASNSWAGEIKLHGGVSVGYPKSSYGVTL